MIEFKPLALANVGVLQFKIPHMVLAAINTEVDVIMKDFGARTPMNANLAGNIQHEYTLESSRYQLEPFIMQCVDIYQQQHEIKSQDVTSGQVKLMLDAIWCNFQKAGEFNPNHTHGGILSFVIWVKVPFDLATEQRESPGAKGNKNNAGCFELLYNTTIGDVATCVLGVDRTWEGQMLLFPAKMTHCVYPFYTSKDYRISVSGNISVG